MESVAIFEAEYNSKISLGVFLVNVKALRQRYPGDVAACCWNLFFSRRGAGAQRLFFKTIHAAGDSGSHDFFPEVQQVAELAAGQLQVRLNLLFVGRCHPFDRFEFQYHPALNDQVRPEAFVKLDALVRDRHRHLPNDLQPALRQLASQHDLVNHLKDPRPKLAMHRNRCLDHTRPDLVLCHPLRLRASAEVLSLSSLLRFQRGPSRTAR
jgi:hypothetical protein